MKKSSCINKKNHNNSNCLHQFERDLIDINPDKSMEITYCILCEYTLTNENQNININTNQKK
jgi:hypothetical protein